jgi:hypothetical protein
MKKLLLATAAVAMFAVPASAATLVNGGTASFDPYSLVANGTLIASSVDVQTALTFKAEFRSAVYRRASDGGLDFVYQVKHLGAGSTGENHEISGFTVGNFAGFTIDARRDGTDHDGAGAFTAPFNPAPAGAGFTTIARRGPNGIVLEADFFGMPNSMTGQVNGLFEGEISTSYIFRTNARGFKAGTYGVSNASTTQGITFAPNAVPEPATWAMMLGGFGLLGAASRRSARAKSVLA